MTDYSETWLRLQKAMKTYEAAATLRQWDACVEAAADCRVYATALLGWALDQQTGTKHDV